MILPFDCENFELIASRGIFRGQNVIGHDLNHTGPNEVTPIAGWGATATNINLTIDRAELKFPAIYDDIEPIIEEFEQYNAVSPVWAWGFGYPYFDEPIVSDERFIWLPTLRNGLREHDFGLLVFSRGNQGDLGRLGSPGANAISKTCGETDDGDGQEAGDGGMGQPGETGGDGGSIYIEVGVMVSDQGDRQSVTQHDIVGISRGGNGGPGGYGGPGGNGVSGHDCFPFGKRSGYPPGQTGPRGPQGATGAAQEVEVFVSIVGGAVDQDGDSDGIPTIPEL